MYTEIVTFPLPEGMSKEELIANYEKTAPMWQDNPDLIRKYYLYDPEQRIGGGVYLWKEKANAAKWHGAEFIQKVKATYGSEPQCQIFATPLLVDNLTGIIDRA